MILPTEFLKLPLLFDAYRLGQELESVDASEWRKHPQGYAGNTALPLVSVNGDPTNEATQGAMRPTPYLDRMPYFKQVLLALQADIGRTRLMRVAGPSKRRSARRLGLLLDAACPCPHPDRDGLGSHFLLSRQIGSYGAGRVLGV